MLIYVPALDTLQTSLTDENLRVRTPPDFVGLDNYARLLADEEFWEVTLRSLLVVALVLPLELVHRVRGGAAAQRALPGPRLVRALVLIPWLVPPVVNGFLWGWLLNGEYGAFNGLLYQLGLIDDYVFWLRDPTSQVVLGRVVQTWTRFAFPMIVLLAGLQGIPDELYDAAKVDGANALAAPAPHHAAEPAAVDRHRARHRVHRRVPDLRRRLDPDLRWLDRRRDQPVHEDAHGLQLRAGLPRPARRARAPRSRTSCCSCRSASASSSSRASTTRASGTNEQSP